LSHLKKKINKFIRLFIVFTVPSKVTAVKSSPLSSTSLRISWNEVGGLPAITYSVSFTSNLESKFATVQDDVSLDSPALDSNTEYMIDVTASNTAGSGETSKSITSVTCKICILIT